MSAALAQRRRLPRGSPREICGADVSARSPDSSGGRGLTLEERLDSVWEGLRADGAAECPICHGRMVAGAPVCCCGACGSRLTTRILVNV